MQFKRNRRSLRAREQEIHFILISKYQRVLRSDLPGNVSQLICCGLPRFAVPRRIALKCAETLLKIGQALRGGWIGARSSLGRLTRLHSWRGRNLVNRPRWRIRDIRGGLFWISWLLL